MDRESERKRSRTEKYSSSMATFVDSLIRIAETERDEGSETAEFWVDRIMRSRLNESDGYYYSADSSVWGWMGNHWRSKPWCRKRKPRVSNVNELCKATTLWDPCKNNNTIVIPKSKSIDRKRTTFSITTTIQLEFTWLNEIQMGGGERSARNIQFRRTSNFNLLTVLDLRFLQKSGWWRGWAQWSLTLQRVLLHPFHFRPPAKKSKAYNDELMYSILRGVSCEFIYESMTAGVKSMKHPRFLSIALLIGLRGGSQN